MLHKDCSFRFQCLFDVRNRFGSTMAQSVRGTWTRVFVSPKSYKRKTRLSSNQRLVYCIKYLGWLKLCIFCLFIMFYFTCYVKLWLCETVELVYEFRVSRYDRLFPYPLFYKTLTPSLQCATKNPLMESNYVIKLFFLKTLCARNSRRSTV